MSEKIIDLFIDKGLILKEEKELFICALEQLIAYILNIFSMIIIGIIFKMLFEAILFTLTYIPIRIYAGGYHSKTQFRCYIFSLIMLISVLLILNIDLLANSILIILLTIIAGFIIVLLAPVEDKNKPLDNTEIEVYTKRTLRNLFIIILILSIFLILKKINFSLCIAISLLCNAIMLILGKIKNSTKYK